MIKKTIVLAAALVVGFALVGCSHPEPEPMPTAPMASEEGPSSKLGTMHHHSTMHHAEDTAHGSSNSGY